MKPIFSLAVAVATLSGVIALTVPASRGAGNDAPIFVTSIPPGYRDWRLISVAHEEGNLNSIGAVLGNDVAIKAYREKKLPFPDGAIIAALHYQHTASDENNKVFARSQSFVARPHHEHPVYGQRLQKICRHGRLGIRFLHERWQICRRGSAQDLLSLPQCYAGSRPGLYPLRTLVPRD